MNADVCVIQNGVTSKHGNNVSRIVAGNLWVNTGDERVDLGLCVKHGAKSMCVPDYVQAQPDNTGWTYSQVLISVVEQYKVPAPSSACCTCANLVMFRHSLLVLAGSIVKLSLV